MDKTRRKRLSQNEIDSLVQETASKTTPRAAATAAGPRPSRAAGPSLEPPTATRPVTPALEETLASVQAAMSRLDVRLGKAEKAFGGFERQINAVEASLVAERQARDEQAKAIGEMKAAGEDFPVEVLKGRLAELAERLEKSEEVLSALEAQLAETATALAADREAREEQARQMLGIQAAVEGLGQPADHAPEAGLAERLAAMEAKAEELEAYRQAFEEALIEGREQHVAQWRTVNTHLKAITGGLKNTLGYNLKKNFKCDSCGAEGVVALKVRCTQCEKENWWGWWPKHKSP